jgi:hypothetical protein
VGGDPRLITEVEALHANFYEGFMDPDDYIHYERQALRLLKILLREIEKIVK